MLQVDSPQLEQTRHNSSQVKPTTSSVTQLRVQLCKETLEGTKHIIKVPIVDPQPQTGV